MIPFFDQVDGVMWALQVDGLPVDFPRLPLGQQLEGWEILRMFKAVAKHEYVNTKHKQSLLAIKAWLREVKPSEFCAKWRDGDDSVQMFYKP